jgi:hypothetical protein
MLVNAQKVGNAGTAGLEGQIGGLQTAQVGLATPNSNNPLNFLYNMQPNSQKAGGQSDMAKIFEPGIKSIQGQEALAQQNIQGFTNTVEGAKSAVQTQIDAYTALKNAGIGRYSTFIDPNTNQVYSFDSATNSYSDKFGNTVKDPTNGKPPTPHPLIDGIDWSSYNGGMDPDYETLMDNSIKSIRQVLPQGLNTVGADGLPVVDTLLKSNRSPLTSSMISLASTQYGIDPIDMIANIQHESVWGTSNIAKADNNFGGIKFANQPNATMGELSPEGDHYAKFNTAQNGLYAQAKLLATYSQGNKLNTTSQQAQFNPIVMSGADEVLSGVKGYTQKYNELIKTFPNAPVVANSLTDAILSKNPNFKSTLSDEYQNNLQKSATIKPNIDAAEKIIGTVDSTGKGSPNGLVDLYDKMVGSSKTNSGWVTGAFGPILGGTGYGVKEQKAFNSAVGDVVSNINSVLSIGRSVGVVANNETVDKLFPQDKNGNYTMDRDTLIQRIQQVQGFEKATYEALTKNPFGANNSASPQTTGSDIQSLRAKYNY